MDEAAFLRAIQDDPANDAHRLVYADWLEERCDNRGEFLRIKCQLSQLSDRLAQFEGQIDREWANTVRKPSLKTNEIRLRTGRVVHLRHLRQFEVYAGLLEGLPTREMNQRIIDRILTEERAQPYAGEPYLVRPVETPLEYHRERYPFGEPAALPSIGCVGYFRCFQPARDQNMHFSELTVVWFQEEFAFPIEPLVLGQLVDIDWERVAGDYEC